MTEEELDKIMEKTADDCHEADYKIAGPYSADAKWEGYREGFRHCKSLLLPRLADYEKVLHKIADGASHMTYDTYPAGYSCVNEAYSVLEKWKK